MPEFEGARDDMILMSAPDMEAIAEANDLSPRPLADAEVQALLAFLKSLEDPAERLGVPQTVPSGLTVER